jgi:hypothetical protein
MQDINTFSTQDPMLLSWTLHPAACGQLPKQKMTSLLAQRTYTRILQDMTPPATPMERAGGLT